MRIIKIDGKKYIYEGLIHDGRAIKAGGRIFVMFPAARLDGRPLEPLPLIGPCELRRVTTEVPDLTNDHPDTVKKIFEQRRAYYENITRDAHLEQYPNDGWITAEQFKSGRARIIEESLEEFARSEEAKEAVWLAHGTDEMAERFGYMNISERALLSCAFRQRSMGEDAAWSEVRKVKWRAHYADPDETVLFLYDLKEEPDPNAGAAALEQQLVQHLEPLSRNMDGMRKVVEVLSANFGRRIQEEKEQTNIQAKKQRYSFTRTGKKTWTVIFGTHEPFQVADSAVGDRLKFVLEHPHEMFDPLRLASHLSAQAGGRTEMEERQRVELGLADATQRKTGRLLTKRDYRAKRADLEQDILEAEAEGRFEEKEERCAELRELEDVWSKTDRDDLSREYKRLHVALERLKQSARRSGMPGGRAFADHLETHLTWASYRLYYNPPIDVHWNT